MKKILISLLAIFCFCSCCNNTTPIEHGEVKYLVEEKYMTIGGWHEFVVSDLNTKETRNIRVGEYTYKITNPGDTLTLKF